MKQFRAVIACVVATVAVSGARADTINNAFGIQARFVGAAASGRDFGPMPLAKASTTGPYDNSVVLSKLHTTMAIEDVALAPSLFVDADNAAAHSATDTSSIDTISRSSDVSIRSIGVVLNINPPAGSGVPIPMPFLDIQASGIKTTAEFQQLFRAPPTAKGNARIGLVTIRGQLVGNAVISVSGPVKPNTIVFQTSQVKITLNRQIAIGPNSCTPHCTKPTVIAVDAISVILNQANWNGQKVSGEIAIGHAAAR